MTNHTDAASSAAVGEHPDAKLALRRLQRHIRVRFAAAVANDGLDPDLANDMLQALGLTRLPRHWSVRLTLTFTAGVTALDAAGAYDATANAIEHALAHASIPVDIEWDDRDPHEAIPGDIDHAALDEVHIVSGADDPT